MFSCSKETFFSSRKLRKIDSFFLFILFTIWQNVRLLALNINGGGGRESYCYILCIVTDVNTEFIFKNRYYNPKEAFSLQFSSGSVNGFCFFKETHGGGAAVCLK